MWLMGMLLVAFCTGLASVSCQEGPEILSFVDITPSGTSATRNRTLQCTVRGGWAAFYRFPGGVRALSHSGLTYYRATRESVGTNDVVFILAFPQQDSSYSGDYQCRARSISGETNSTNVITIRADGDECLPMPCRNGAACTDGFMSYQCTCRTGFTGVNCGTPMAPEIRVLDTSCKDGNRTLRCLVHTNGDILDLVVYFARLPTGLPARGGSLPYDTTFDITTTGGANRMISFPVDDADYEGVYQCRGRSRFGTSTADIEVEAGTECHPTSRKTVIIAATSSAGAILLLVLALTTAVCVRARRRMRARATSNRPNVSTIMFMTHQLPAEFGGDAEQIGNFGGPDNAPEGQVEGGDAPDETTIEAKRGIELSMLAIPDVDYV